MCPPVALVGSFQRPWRCLNRFSSSLVVSTYIAKFLTNFHFLTLCSIIGTTVSGVTSCPTGVPSFTSSWLQRPHLSVPHYPLRNHRTGILGLPLGQIWTGSIAITRVPSGIASSGNLLSHVVVSMVSRLFRCSIHDASSPNFVSPPCSLHIFCSTSLELSQKITTSCHQMYRYHASQLLLLLLLLLHFSSVISTRGCNTRHRVRTWSTL